MSPSSMFPGPTLQGSIQRVVLTGFMGAGKSTVGALLAGRLGWRFLDVDRYIARREQATVAEIFGALGEAAFRALERTAIAELLLREQAVIALGGGALESAETRERLHESAATHIVFLETPLEIALARCRRGTGGAARPLLADAEALRTRYEARLHHYRQAHQTVASGHQTPGEIADALAASLAGRLAPRASLAPR